jgi:cell division protein FtsQ
VVPLFPAKKSKASKPKAVRRESKRLSIHERNARASVARLRPKTSFGRKVTIALAASLSALVILVVVLWVSPVLAVKQIEVVGDNLVSEKSILKDLKSLKGRPLPQITTEEVAAKLSKYELIDSVSAVSVPPNTLRIVVIERSAIAIVVINGLQYRYDPAGVQLGRAKSEDRLPFILGAGNPSTSKAFVRSIDVLLSLPNSLLNDVLSIKASSKDNVFLKLRTRNQSILWGDSSQPGLKAKVLLALMKHYERSAGITFDVSSPNQPSVY